MSVSPTSIPDWVQPDEPKVKPALSFKQWALRVAFAAVLIGGGIAFGSWIASKISSTSTAVQSGHALLQNLQKSDKDLRNEVSRLNDLVKSQKKGNATVTQILQLAGTAVAQLEQQMSNICGALNSAHITNTMCSQVSFVIPPAGSTPTTTTTTIPAAASHTLTVVTTTTTTASFLAPIVSPPTTTTTIHPPHGNGHGHGHGHSKLAP